MYRLAGGEHRFAIALPTELDARVEVDGVFGDTLRTIQSLRSMTESSTRWVLAGVLEIPWKRNLSKEVELCVTGVR